MGSFATRGPSWHRWQTVYHLIFSVQQLNIFNLTKHTLTLTQTHRLLEEDHKFLTHSNSLQGSTCSDSTSIHSTDSLSSLRSPNTSHDNPPHLSPPLHTPSADSPLLHSPTEVRRKPLLLTSYEDRDSDNEGLGPNASILLDDGFETRIEYSEVVSPEVGTSNYGEMATADNDSDPSDLTTTIRG